MPDIDGQGRKRLFLGFEELGGLKDAEPGDRLSVVLDVEVPREKDTYVDREKEAAVDGYNLIIRGARISSKNVRVVGEGREMVET